MFLTNKLMSCSLLSLMQLRPCVSISTETAAMLELLAQEQSRSQLLWIIRTTGLGGLFIVMSALVVFVLTIVVVTRGRGPIVGPTLVLLLHGPFALSVLCVLKGLIASFSVIAMSDQIIKPSMWAEALSEALLFPFVALLLTAPSYLIAVVALLVRSLGRSEQGTVTQPTEVR